MKFNLWAQLISQVLNEGYWSFKFLKWVVLVFLLTTVSHIAYVANFLNIVEFVNEKISKIILNITPSDIESLKCIRKQGCLERRSLLISMAVSSVAPFHHMAPSIHGFKIVDKTLWVLRFNHGKHIVCHGVKSRLQWLFALLAFVLGYIHWTH